MVGADPITFEREFFQNMARMEQLLADRTQIVTDIARSSRENTEALARLETKIAIISTTIDSGLVKTVDAVKAQITDHERRDEIMRSRVFGVMIVIVGAVLSVIGYLFHLHFGGH